jgi:hypothetical protein
MLCRTSLILWSLFLLFPFSFLSAQQNNNIVSKVSAVRSGQATVTISAGKVAVKNPALRSSSSVRLEPVQQSQLFIARSQPVAASLPVKGAYFSINSALFDTLAPQPRTTFPVPGFYLGSNAMAYTLELERFDILAPGFSAVTGTKNGDVSFSPDKHLLFAGRVREIPGSYVYIAVFRSYCYGYIELSQPQDTTTHRYIIAPVSLDDAEPVMVISDEHDPHEREPEHVLCSTDEAVHTVGPVLRQDVPAGKRGTEKPKTTFTLTAGIAIDCDYEYYQDHGSNLSRATNYALAVAGASSAIYYRDVNIRLVVPYLRIWTSTDPYTGTTASALLAQFRNYWNSNMTSVRRTLAHLFSGINSIGGVAFVDVLCSDGVGFAVSGLNNNVTFPASGYVWDVDVMSHEMGHNFGSPHTHSCTWAPPIDSCYDAEGSCFSGRVYRVGSIMSYCHLSSGKYLAFHPRVTTLIRSKAENAACVPAGIVTSVNDVAVIAIAEPVAGAMIATSANFSPTVVFRNNGSANQTNLTATCEITDNEGNQVYSSTQTISSLSSGASSTATFSSTRLRVVNNYFIRSSIALSNDAYINDNSMVRPFAVTPAVSGSVTVTAPGTGVTMAAADTYTLTWTKNGVSNVLIEFSANNGLTWSTVHSNNSSTSYIWTVPGIATTRGRIRISDRSNSATSDISDSPFTITLNNDIQPIEFIVPTDGGTATAPFTPRIAFRNNGGVAQMNVPVRLRAVNVTTNREVYNVLSTIGSITVAKIDTIAFPQFTTSASGSYMWYARVLLANDQNPSNDSLTRTSLVTIVPPTLLLTSPNGREKWQAGIMQNITWTSTGFLPSVKIEYSMNGGSSWTTIVASTSNTGSFLWTVPNVSASQAWVRVSDVSNPAVNDMGNAAFTLVALQPPAALTAVNGNDQIVLRWGASGNSGVTGYKIYRGTTAQALSSYATVSGQVYLFTDTDVVDCTPYYYSVSTLVNAVESVQATQATITAGTNATLTLVSPNGGEKWQAGLSKVISWSTEGCVPSVTIEYSTNNGVEWTTITSAVINTGSYTWTVSNTPSTQALIRVGKVADMSVGDAGNTAFVIGAIAPPSVVQVTFANVSTVITWAQSTSSGVTGYAVYRKTGTGAFALIGTTATTAYYDAATTSNTLYSYAVSTHVNNAKSVLSRPVDFLYLLPVITANGPATFCAGGSVTLDAGSGYSSYLWSNGATTQTITVTQSGIYRVTVTNTAGYSAYTQINITVYTRPALVISKSGPTTFCAGSSVTLDAGSGYSSYLWSNGATTQSITATQSGNYTVTVMNAGGCSATSTQNVSVRPRPVVTIAASGPTTFCAGSSVTLDAGSGYSSYLWSNGATTQSITVTQSGNYMAIVMNSSGCSAMSTQTVSVISRSSLVITASGPTTFCAGASVTLDAGSGYSSYLWSNGATTQTISVAQSGSYSVTIGNAGGCQLTSTQTVSVRPRPVVTIAASGPTTFCAGSSVTLDAGSGYSSYLWSNGATTQTIIVTESGNYTVVAANESGCSDESPAVPVLVTSAVVASAGADTTICVGGSVQLSASGGAMYIWQPATGLDNPFVAHPLASPVVTTTYIVTAIGEGGCSASDTVVVNVQPVTASIAVFLQGAYSSGKLMNTGLQMQNLVPLQQPYAREPFNYDGTEQVDSVPDGIVDWVLVEFRSATNASVVVTRRAALLRDNGEVVDVDGSSPLAIPSLSAGDYYIVVRHRTHLAAMSAEPVLLAPDCSLYHSFTSSQAQAYSLFNEPMIYLGPSLYGLITGDQSADGIISAPDRVGVRNNSGATGYLSADIVMDGLVNAMDRVVTRNNTFRVTQLP